MRGPWWKAVCGVAFACGAAASGADPITANRLEPPGGAAGSTLQVRLHGTLPRWPLAVWTDRPGTTWRPLEESGIYEVAIAAGDSLGVHRLRFHDAAGASGVRRFVVGQEPEAIETEPNDQLPKAMPLATLPVTVNGVLDKAADVDCFAVTLAAGQTLVATVDANGALAAPLDAVLEIVSPRGGYLARNLDARGLDPRIVFRAARDGTYLLRIVAFPAEPNSTIGLASGPDYVYRLTLTTGPCLSGTLPLALPVEAAVPPLLPLGWNLPDAHPQPVIAAAGDGSAWVAYPGFVGAVELPRVAGAIVSGRVDGEAAVAAVPVVVSGCIDRPGGAVTHRFTATAGTRLVIGLVSHAAGFDLDSTLEILDATGARVFASADRDASGVWAVPADGEYRLVVRDRRGTAGPDKLYRVSIEPETPRIACTTETDVAAAAVGAAVEIAVAVDRQRGWAEPVEIVLLDPPAGISATPVLSAVDGDSAKKVTLAVTAAAPFAGPLRIVARRPGGGDVVAPVACGKEKLPVCWFTATPP